MGRKKVATGSSKQFHRKEKTLVVSLHKKFAETSKEPLHKSRVVATEARRDEMHEATRSQMVGPIVSRRDTADRPLVGKGGPVPSATHVGLLQTFPKRGESK